MRVLKPVFFLLGFALGLIVTNSAEADVLTVKEKARATSEELSVASTQMPFEADQIMLVAIRDFAATLVALDTKIDLPVAEQVSAAQELLNQITLYPADASQPVLQYSYRNLLDAMLEVLHARIEAFQKDGASVENLKAHFEFASKQWSLACFDWSAARFRDRLADYYRVAAEGVVD